MSKKLKVFIIVILVFVISTFLIIGCGSKTSANITGTEAVNSNDKTPVTMEYWTNYSWGPDDAWGKDNISKVVKEKTGVNLKVSRPTDDTGQQLNLRLAADNLPDMFFIDNNDPLRKKLPRSGKVFELGPLIDKYAPEMKANLGEQYWKITAADDGKYYYYANCVPTDKTLKIYTAVGPWNPNSLFREDLYNEMGKPDISTPDGLFKTLMMVKEKYPDKIPIAMGMNQNGTGIGPDTGGIGYLKTMFGVEHYYENNGKVTAAYKDPAYRDFLSYCNKLFKNGLITRDMFATNQDKWKSIWDKGEVFYLVDSINHVGYRPTGNKNVRFLPAPAFNTMRMVQQSGLMWGATFISKSNKTPDKAIKLLSFISSDEGDKLLEWGIENKDYKIDANGEAYFPPEVMKLRQEDITAYTKATGFRKYFWGINYHDHQIERTMMKRDPLMKETLDLYGKNSYWRVWFSSLVLEPSSIEGINLQKIQEEFKRDFPNLIMADSESAQSAMLDAMIKKYDSDGMLKIEDAWTKISNNWKKIYGVTDEDQWIKQTFPDYAPAPKRSN